MTDNPVALTLKSHDMDEARISLHITQKYTTIIRIVDLWLET